MQLGKPAVLEADGGTRTAAINGAWVALIDALPTAEELIDSIVAQAAEVLKNLSSTPIPALL